jgi:AcrR family transcriptional regulator
MPRPRTDDSQLLDALCEVFRAHGYRGASLTEFSAASGLGRASLYHRFPGGKLDMALAVVAHVQQHFGTHVLAPLAGSGDVRARIGKCAKRIAEFYRDGSAACLLDTLGMSDEPKLQSAISATFSALLEAFANVSHESGVPLARSRRLAEEAVALIEGALVMSRGAQMTAPFKRFLAELPERLAPRN